MPKLYNGYITYYSIHYRQHVFQMRKNYVISAFKEIWSCQLYVLLWHVSLSLTHTHTHTHTHTTRLLSNFGHYNKFEKKMFYYTKLIDEYKQINGIMINIIFMSLVKSVIYL